jgi:hypothetical protein
MPPRRNSRLRQPGAGRQHGGVLPLAMLVLSVMALLTLQTVRTTLTQAGLTRSLLGAAAAAGAARANSAAALAAVTASPALLPPAMAGARRDMSAAFAAGGTARAELVFAGSDSVCPRLPGVPVTRHHYEIISSATTAKGATQTEYQGFYVCREVCPPPCIGAVTPPVASYWRTGPAP